MSDPNGDGNDGNDHIPNHQGNTMGATVMGIMLAFNVVMNLLRHGSWIYRSWCKRVLGYHIYEVMLGTLEAKSKYETNRRVCRLIRLAASAKGQELHHFSLVEPCGTHTHLELPSFGGRKISVGAEVVWVYPLLVSSSKALAGFEFWYKPKGFHKKILDLIHGKLGNARIKPLLNKKLNLNRLTPEDWSYLVDNVPSFDPQKKEAFLIAASKTDPGLLWNVGRAYLHGATYGHFFEDEKARDVIHFEPPKDPAIGMAYLKAALAHSSFSNPEDQTKADEWCVAACLKAKLNPVVILAMAWLEKEVVIDSKIHKMLYSKKPAIGRKMAAQVVKGFESVDLDPLPLVTLHYLAETMAYAGVSLIQDETTLTHDDVFDLAVSKGSVDTAIMLARRYRDASPIKASTYYMDALAYLSPQDKRVKGLLKEGKECVTR